MTDENIKQNDHFGTMLFRTNATCTKMYEKPQKLKLSVASKLQNLGDVVSDFF